MEAKKQNLVTFGSPGLCFPFDVYNWMKLNANPKMTLKLMKVCKYFQHSNGFPFFVVKDILLRDLTWILVTLDNKKITTKSLETIPDKLWIVGQITIKRSPKGVANLLLKSVVLNIETLILSDQNVTMDEFKLLTDSETVERCYMKQSTIISENGKIVSVEDILECLPNVRIILFGNTAPSINSLEAAEAKISSKLEKLTLHVDSKNFNVETLLAYMKNHQKIQYTIWFCEISKVEFGQTIEPTVKKVIQEWSPDYHAPKIYHYEEIGFKPCFYQVLDEPLQNVQ